MTRTHATRAPSARAWILLAAVAASHACGDAAAPELGDGGRLVSWGSTGILYESRFDNLRFVRNVLEYLGDGREVGGTIEILYADPCDPRTDPELCQLAGDFATLRPFFDVVDQVGTITFGLASEVDVDDFSLVIANFCGAAAQLGERTVLGDYLETGGRAFVLGDNFCHPRAGADNTRVPSAALATLVTQMYGISFTALDPQIDEPLTVPSGDRSGLLTGVAQLSIWRVTPQLVSGNAAAVVVSADGPLAAAVGR